MVLIPNRPYSCETCGNVRVLQTIGEFKDGRQGHYCFICKKWVEYKELENEV